MTETQTATGAAETELDYEERYDLPIHWSIDPHDRVGTDYYDYVERTLALVPSGRRRVLDAGCGDGYVSAQLVRAGHEVVGFDASPSAIGFAKVLVPGAMFHVSDIAASEGVTGDEKFDTALLMEVLEHIPVDRQADALGALRRQLRDGAQFLLTVPTTNVERSHWHYKHYTVEDATALLAEAGFRVERIVFQHRLGPLTKAFIDNATGWKFVTNRVYDLKLVRRALTALFRRSYGLAPDESTAGRLIIDARAV